MKIASSLLFPLALWLISPAHADPVAEVRAIFLEITAASLLGEAHRFEDSSGPDGAITILRPSGEGPARKVVAAIDPEGTRPRHIEVYFDGEARVRFVFCREPDAEFRYYFATDGSLASALIKEDGPNRPLQNAPGDRILEAAKATADVDSPAAALPASLDLAAAVFPDGEADVSADPADGIAIEWPADTRFAATFGVSGVAHEMLRFDGIEPGNNEMPPPVETVINPEADPPTSIVLTFDGLEDDSIRSVRYRCDFSFGDDKVWRPVFFGKQIRCQNGRGPEEWSKEFCL